MPVTRPEPASGAGARTKKADTKKRARVAAGSTALLAACCVFVFMGPVPFWPDGGTAPALRGSVCVSGDAILDAMISRKLMHCVHRVEVRSIAIQDGFFASA